MKRRKKNKIEEEKKRNPAKQFTNIDFKKQFFMIFIAKVCNQLSKRYSINKKIVKETSSHNRYELPRISERPFY